MQDLKNSSHRLALNSQVIDSILTPLQLIFQFEPLAILLVITNKTMTCFYCTNLHEHTDLKCWPIMLDSIILRKIFIGNKLFVFKLGVLNIS